MTSRWLLEVQRLRAIEVRWHVMSLSVLNEHRDLPESYRRLMDDSWAAVRVLIAAQEMHGAEHVRPLYDALGTRRHPGGRTDTSAIIREALDEVGLPASLASYADTDELDEPLRASHGEATALVGEDVGTPVVAVNGVALFGPVMTPAPKGDDAARLWDGLVLVTGVPGFYELKRTRTADPSFD
ncbi:mycothiol-dependent nitroreductase Rv2466c family protein [Cellulomonas soli]